MICLPIQQPFKISTFFSTKKVGWVAGFRILTKEGTRSLLAAGWAFAICAIVTGSSKKEKLQRLGGLQDHSQSLFLQCKVVLFSFWWIRPLFWTFQIPHNLTAWHYCKSGSIPDSATCECHRSHSMWLQSCPMHLELGTWITEAHIKLCPSLTKNVQRGTHDWWIRIAQNFSNLVLAKGWHGDSVERFWACEKEAVSKVTKVAVHQVT